MFSGIVKEIGIVKSLEQKDGLLEIIISSKSLINSLQAGSSVAVNGCCLTITEVRGQRSEVRKTEFSPLTSHLSALGSGLCFKVQVTQETLSKTNFHNLKVGSKVNLEPSMKLGDPLDGHLVLGHIDACGEIVNIFSQNENRIVEILFPNEIKDFIVKKGSISVNGVSLTIVEVKDKKFNFSLIPYTCENTNLGLLRMGDLVNLEVDSISRYVINYLENSKQLVVN